MVSLYNRDYSVDGWPISKKGKALTIQEVFEELIEAERKLKNKQAEIDSLMLEYCPEEMTAEQKATRAKHQIRVDKK